MKLVQCKIKRIAFNQIANFSQGCILDGYIDVENEGKSSTLPLYDNNKNPLEQGIYRVILPNIVGNSNFKRVAIIKKKDIETKVHFLKKEIVYYDEKIGLMLDEDEWIYNPDRYVMIDVER